MVFTSLQTERLTLRPYALSDIPALVPLIGAREVAATTLRIAHPYAESDARDFIARAQDSLLSGDELRLGIFLREKGALCGGVGLRIEREHCRAELGYWIGVPYWGNGYATEASKSIAKYGFETLGLHRVFPQPRYSQSRVGQSLEKDRHASRGLPTRPYPEVGR